MVYFHGTLTEHLPLIARDGLIPRPLGDGTTGICLSSDYRFAAQWATNLAARWAGGVLVYDPHTVLRVDVPHGVAIDPDPNLPGEDRSVVVRQRIAPTRIKALRGTALWSAARRWVSLSKPAP